jgi:hypothetical protein
MPQLFPSILPGADHTHEPLVADGDDDEEEESTDGDTDGDKAP